MENIICIPEFQPLEVARPSIRVPDPPDTIRVMSFVIKKNNQNDVDKLLSKCLELDINKIFREAVEFIRSFNTVEGIMSCIDQITDFPEFGFQEELIQLSFAQYISIVYTQEKIEDRSIYKYLFCVTLYQFKYDFMLRLSDILNEDTIFDSLIDSRVSKNKIRRSTLTLSGSEIVIEGVTSADTAVYILLKLLQAKSFLFIKRFITKIGMKGLFDISKPSPLVDKIKSDLEMHTVFIDGIIHLLTSMQPEYSESAELAALIKVFDIGYLDIIRHFDEIPTWFTSIVPISSTKGVIDEKKRSKILCKLKIPFILHEKVSVNKKGIVELFRADFLTEKDKEKACYIVYNSVEEACKRLGKPNIYGVTDVYHFDKKFMTSRPSENFRRLAVLFSRVIYKIEKLNVGHLIPHCI